MPQFFHDKAVFCFFGKGVTASDFGDYALGEALDGIASYGSEELYGELAFETAKSQGFLGLSAHLDHTSFILQGEYDTQDTETITVLHSHSKYHRSELKQLIVTSATTCEDPLSIWIVFHDDNNSDHKRFHDMVKHVCDCQANQDCTIKGSAASKIYGTPTCMVSQECRF